MKIKNERTLSRKNAAEWLHGLADQLAAGNEVELDRYDIHMKFDVPDEVELEVELEIEDGRTELEIELHW